MHKMFGRSQHMTTYTVYCCVPIKYAKLMPMCTTCVQHTMCTDKVIETFSYVGAIYMYIKRCSMTGP